MKIVPVFCILLTMLSCATKPDDSLSSSERKDIEKEIESHIDDFIKNYNEKNLDEAFKDIANKKEFKVGVGGEFMDYPRFYRHIKGFLDKVDTLEAKKVKSYTTIITRDVAIYSMIQSQNLTLRNGKHYQPTYAVTFLFRKIDNVWRVVYLHESE